MKEGDLVLDDGHGRRVDLGVGTVRVDGQPGPGIHNRGDGVHMSKVAFCFPGQGSLEAGMGRDFAEAVPEAMEVFERGDEASGLDLEKLCFESPLAELVETEVQQPALVATCLAMLAALRLAGIEPDFVVGHSVGEFAALPAAGSMATPRRRARPRARARDGGGCAASTRARWRRSSASTTRPSSGSAATSLGVWPANYNCPGQLVISGRTKPSTSAASRGEAEGARRDGQAQGVGRVPQPARREGGGAPAPGAGAVRFHETRAPFMSTVTARIEPAQRLGTLLVDQLTAPVKFTQAASALVKEGARTFVEVGPGNVLSGLVKRIDRSVKAIPVNNIESLKKLKEALHSA